MYRENPPSSSLARALLAFFVLLHAGLGLWFSASTPYRQAGFVLSQGRAPAPDIGAPDEREHANYVARLVDGQGFPVFDYRNPDPEGIEYHQPPLYYGAAAGFAKLIGLNGDAIRSPSGRAVRWPNLLFGALGVLGAYALGTRGYGRRDVGLLAAAFFALLPMNVALTAAASNDPLLIALFVWTIALAFQGVREGWTTRLAIGCGVLTGLAVLTKTTGLALLPILGLAAALRRPTLAQAAGVVLPAALLPLPWLLRNQSLYGDPFALRAFSLAFTHTAQASTFTDRTGMFGYLVDWLGWWTARSSIGAFGYMDIWLNETGSPYTGPNALYRLALALLFVAFVGWVLRLRQADATERRLHALGAFAFVVVAALFLRFGLQYFQAQGRYLFPALGPIAAGVAWGALRLSRDRWPVALAAVAGPLLAFALLAGSVLPAEFAKRV